jgi:hypothetical protein
MMEDKSPLRTTLYLDDIRTPSETLPNAHPWNVVRDYDSFVDFITSNGIPDLISFDHDLAKEHQEDYYAQVFKNGYQNPDYDSYREKTGLDCAKFLCEYAERMNQEIKTCVVHSHNPVGAQNIMSYINGFMKHMGWSGSCYQHRFPYIKTNTK